MEINYNSAAALRIFLDEHGLGMRKKFGQNFLINPAVRQAIVQALDAPAGASVWEIGPGLGAMTSLLLENGLAVRAFEIDTGFSRILNNCFGNNANFTLVEGDVLKTWPQAPAAPFLLGNLPYNIAAVLIANFIEQGRLFDRMVVTVQREVALRLAAGPGSADYSSLSVLCASAYNVKLLMTIKGASFYPRPNVDSAAVLLEKKENNLSQKTLPAVLYPLVRQLFSSRRKTIKNNLAGFFTPRNNGRGAPAELAAAALAKTPLDGTRRAENLSVDEFTALAKTIEDMGIL